MILTSYYSNYRNFPLFRNPVSVSRFLPTKIEQALELAPSAELLKDYKQNNDIDYETRYRKETLNKLDPTKISKKYENAIFLCYEKDGDFCHRSIIRDWLKENGIKSQELKKETKRILILDRGIEPEDNIIPLIKRLISNYSKVELNDSSNISRDLANKYNLKLVSGDDYDTGIIFSRNSIKIDNLYSYNLNKKIFE